jgi:hypothetical protein
MTALKPEGCVGGDCALPGRSFREGGVLDGVLLLGAVVLIGVGVAALMRRAQGVGRFGRLGRIGLLCASVGLALVLSGLLFIALTSRYIPFVMLPGGVVLFIGIVILSVAILRADVLPRWSAAVLLLGSLAMFNFNYQDARVLLAIPFGLAWVGVGFALWSTRSDWNTR